MNIDEKLRLIEDYKKEVIDEISFNNRYINSIHDNNSMDEAGKEMRKANVNDSKLVVNNLKIELNTIMKIQEMLKK